MNLLQDAAILQDMCGEAWIPRGSLHNWRPLGSGAFAVVQQCVLKFDNGPGVSHHPLLRESAAPYPGHCQSSVKFVSLPPCFHLKARLFLFLVCLLFCKANKKSPVDFMCQQVSVYNMPKGMVCLILSC